MISWYRIGLAIALCVALAACSSGRRHKPPSSSSHPGTSSTYNPAPTPSVAESAGPSADIPRTDPLPPRVEVRVDVENFAIVRHRVLTDSGETRGFRINRAFQKSLDGSAIYIEMRPRNENLIDAYYFAKVAPIRDGSTTIEFTLFHDPIPLNDLPTPKTDIPIRVSVVNKRVVAHEIEEIGDSTAHLYVERVDWIGTKPVVVLKSTIYEDLEWHMEAPQTDGNFHLYATMVQH